MSIDDYRTKSKEGGFDTEGLSNAEMLLNPESFKAVGKVEGWGTLTAELNPQPHAVWLTLMHRMIDALAEGKTIEQFIETL